MVISNKTRFRNFSVVVLEIGQLDELGHYQNFLTTKSEIFSITFQHDLFI